MNDYPTTLYLIAVAVCLFSTAAFVRIGAECTRHRFFSLYLVLQAMAFLFEFLMAHSGTSFKAVWLAGLMAVSLLLAPCVWLAFREHVAGARLSWKELPALHCVALIVGFACLLPLISAANSGTTFSDPANPAGPVYSLVIHASMLVSIAVFALQAPWFLWKCRQIVRLHPRQNARWSEMPIAIVFTMWGLGIVRTLDCAFWKWPPVFSLIVAAVSVAVSMAALYALVARLGEPPVPRGESYLKSPLSGSVRARIRRKLEKVVVADQAYKNGDLTLAALSEALNEKPHYVSQVLSQDLDSNFHDFVNQLRIADAKRQLLDAPQRTVLEVAMAAGFNSKSAFHSAFRRQVGMAPTEWRRGGGIPSSDDGQNVLADRTGRI